MTLKRILRYLSTFTFRFVLFFTISVIAFAILYTDSSYVKTVFDRNEVYDRVVDAVLETNKDQSITADGSLTLNDEEIQEIIRAAFPAEELKASTELVINSTYEWLEQDADRYTFTIDLTENQLRLADGISAYAIQTLAEKPVCEAPPVTIDPFSSPCRPPNLDLALEQEFLRQQILQDGIFIEDPIITEQTVFAGESTEPVGVTYSYIPSYFSLAQALPAYIIILLIALGLFSVFIHNNRKLGAKKIGKIMISVGISLVVFTVFFSFILPTFTGTVPVLQSSGEGLDNLVNDVGIDMSRDYARTVLLLCIPVIGVGFVLFYSARTIQKKKKYAVVSSRASFANANERKKPAKPLKKRGRPPIISSESSETKPKKRKRNSKYRKIPKKEL